jgi:hypothetical protein
VPFSDAIVLALIYRSDPSRRIALHSVSPDLLSFAVRCQWFRTANTESARNMHSQEPTAHAGCNYSPMQRYASVPGTTPTVPNFTSTYSRPQGCGFSCATRASDTRVSVAWVLFTRSVSFQMLPAPWL